MTRAATVDIGTRLRYAGRDWTIVAQPALNIGLRDDQGLEITATWGSILQAPDYAVLGLEENPPHPYHVMFASLPQEVRDRALVLERHVLEVLIGAQERGGPINPHYDPGALSQNERIRRKVEELRGENRDSKVSDRQVKRWLSAYQQSGQSAFGLVDRRHLRVRESHSEADRVVMRAIDEVQADLRGRSDVSLNEIRRLTRNKLEAGNQLAESEEDKVPDRVRMPARTKFSELVRVVAPTLFKSARQRDSILANLKKRPFGRATADRPGQVILLDYTRFDLRAISEVDGSELNLRLLIAQDLYSRAIVGWDLVEVEPRGVDATRLVIGILFPKLWHPAWPETSRWRYTGVPQEIIVTEFGLPDGTELAGPPPLLPEQLVIDGGKIFIGQHLHAVADEFGLDFRYARPYKGSDKAHVEVLFRTIRVRFAEGLRGYVGPNIQHRGKKVRGYHTRGELMRLVGEMITSEYNERCHDALYDPDRPKVKISPNRMLDLGLSMQGLFTVPRSRNAYYLALRPVKVRRIKENGVHLEYRRYDGPELNPYRGGRSPFTHLKGEWIFLIDDRDPSYIFFQDPLEDGNFFPIPWVDADHLARPFQDVLKSGAWESHAENGFENHAEIDARRDARRNRYDALMAEQDRQGRAEAVKRLLKFNDKSGGGKLDRADRNTLARENAAQQGREALLGTEAPPPLEPVPGPGIAPGALDDLPFDVDEDNVEIRTLDFDDDLEDDDLAEVEDSEEDV
ncbi:DDE-type integrase/transposase/recombinase [Deinococcus sp. NW-56]|uniref:DDE-type integrase/transposase/recombinase n=1 Tax=Deinococcus sp. NW-56 TaxID=2080419 RepID=UPI000CF4AF1E|nr:DDE-type integrase/transposase/recombinase [Deinococcus sp. NW-56]